MGGEKTDIWIAVTALGCAPDKAGEQQSIVEWARNTSRGDSEMLVSILNKLAQGEQQKISRHLNTIACAARAKDKAAKRLRLIKEELAKIKQRANKQEGITFPT